MEMEMRKEVHEFIRVCERLIGFARLSKGALSFMECEAILYYIQELERDVFSHCKKRHPSVQSIQPHSQ